MLSLRPLCDAFARDARARYDAERAKLVIPRRLDMYTRDALARAPTSGDVLLRALRDALATFDRTNAYARSSHQRVFHESMIASCVRHPYKDEFDGSFARILAENGWDQARQPVGPPLDPMYRPKLTPLACASTGKS